MVDRRHLEDALLAKFETADLEDHRHCLHHEDAADDDQQELLLRANCRGAERTTDRERSGIAHENFRRVAVEPKETETRTGQRHQEHGKLADVKVVRDHKVFDRHEIVPGKVGEQRVGQCGADRATGSKPVEPVGEVHCVRASDDDPREERNDEEAKLQQRRFEKRKTNRIDADRLAAAKHEAGLVACDARGINSMARDLRLVINEQGRHQRDHQLPEQFRAAAQTIGFFLAYFFVIIAKAKQSAGRHRARAHRDKRVERTRADQCRNDHRSQDQYPTHRWRAKLATMKFRKFVDFFRRAQWLTQLHRNESADHARAKDQRKQEGKNACARRAEGDVLKEVEK